MTNKLMDKKEATQELVNSRQRSSGYKRERERAMAIYLLDVMLIAYWTISTSF